VLIPLALFFAVLAFMVSFVWFTLLYFVASLWNKDSGHGSFKNGSFGRASGDVDNHLEEEGGQERKRQAKGKAVKHATELLTGDSSSAEGRAGKPEIKEVHVDGFSEVSLKITRIASSGASLNNEVRTNDDRAVENSSIFEISTEGMHANADLEGFSRIDEVQGVPVDSFGDEHNFRVVSSSTSGDSLPSIHPINSAQIHDVPDMNEVIEMSTVFLVGSNQNMAVPSNTSTHPNEEYGEELFEDRKGLSDCTPYGIIDFIDKHETRDEALHSSFAKDEIVQLSASSDGSAHGRIPDEHDKESTEENDAESVPEFLIDSVATPEDFDEQGVPEIPITEADTEQSVAASNEVHDFSNEDETAVLSLYSVCEDKDSSGASTHHYNGYQDDKQVEAIENSIVDFATRTSDSVACDFVDQTGTRANDDSVNGSSTGEVVSRESSEDEAEKANDNSTSEVSTTVLERAFCLVSSLRLIE
jgi:hypothetical protein